MTRWNGRPVEFVDRVIGLAGDTIEMVNGVPVINGQLAVQKRVGHYDAYPGFPGHAAPRLRETFADGATFDVIKKSRNGPGDEGGPVQCRPAAFS